MPESVVLVDNTTLAGAGRVMAIDGYTQAPGYAHAVEYYEANFDSQSYDYSSFLEFITALVLFDELVWDGSSCIQEEEGEGSLGEDPNDFGANDLWVYDWFPPFEDLRAKGILRAFADGAYFGPRRLERARRAAMAWVKNNMVANSVVLPSGFHVPIAYKVNGYRDYDLFVKLNSTYELSADNLALAAFLHRGISYQARAVSQSGWSYLPHSFRATLLCHPTLSAVAPFCDSGRFPVAHEQRAHEVIQSMGEVLTKAVQDSVSISPISSSLAIGGAFHQWSPDDAKEVFLEAVRFRESPPGHDLRLWFAELLQRGASTSKVPVANRLREMDRDLRAFILSRFGSVIDGDKEEIQLLELTDGLRKFTEPLIRLLPLEWQESLSRLLNQRIGPDRGYQVLLSYYLPGQRLL
jgi:hypothetical protein